jgi:GNAT superfamily N-acetyltransferase
MPTIRTFAAHEWPTYRDLRLRALAESPEAFGRTLAEEEGRPERSWIERLANGAASEFELPLVADLDGTPAGLAWGHRDADAPETAHVFQMWVAPEFRRLGAARMLLEAIIEWASDSGVRTLLLAVTCGNVSARTLYERKGFVPAGEPEPLRPESELFSQRMLLDLGSRVCEDDWT